MDCSICQREHDAKRRPFLCAVDARNLIYESRIAHAQALIQNELYQSKIANILKSSPSSGNISSQKLTAEEDTQRILAAAQKLKLDIQKARDDIQERKTAILRRRQELVSVRKDAEERRPKLMRDLRRNAENVSDRWFQDADEMASTRSFLCLEAARLYGLKKTKGSGGRHNYSLGRIPVVDLTGMNSMDPAAISTSLAHITHLLMLVSHYFAVRLPAQITLPHRDYPRPTIFNLASSYQPGTPSFANTPGVSSSQTVREGSAPRARPLFIDKPLSQILKEDPTTYSFFLEGVTLLAYDIAWLCCSQGVSVADLANFDEVCQLGRNLYNLLITQQTPARVAAVAGAANNADAPSWRGRYSHGSTYYSLVSAEGTELVRSFRIPGPMKLADKLRRKLMGDAPDWEVLEDDAWKVEEGDIGSNDQPTVAKEGTAKRKESQGWMKVKSRGPADTA